MPPARIDRLSALDATFLALDAPTAPLHVGWTMRFEGPAPPLAQLRRHLDARLAHVPRFRRRVVVPPLGLGDPRWADDPSFDVANHVHQLTVERPGGAGELRTLAGRLLSTPLDAARPLWRLYLVDGLARDEFALIGQAHHALVDGIAALEVAMLLFAPEHESAKDGKRWRPEPPPGALTGAGDAAISRSRATIGAARSLARSARLPSPARLQAAGTTLREVGQAIESLARPTATTSLERTATHRRSVAFASVSLEGARSAGKRNHATINDVLLAACTMALGRALRRRGEEHDEIKVLVPVSTRAAGTASELGNKISFMAVELPVADVDAVTVLRTVRNRTRAAKQASAHGPLDVLTRVADVLPPASARLLATSAWKTASFNAIVSNPGGLPVELSLLGRPLKALYPAVPVSEGQSLTIGALSYLDRLHVGLYADAEVVYDVVEIARDLENAFDVLQLEATHAPTPWRERATEKRARLRAVR
ncbi:MAG TPA: wax ester/triacylglycerol synthase family O-acyltransferase [Solirubrobacteraceae bacterium]